MSNFCGKQEGMFGRTTENLLVRRTKHERPTHWLKTWRAEAVLTTFSAWDKVRSAKMTTFKRSWKHLIRQSMAMKVCTTANILSIQSSQEWTFLTAKVCSSITWAGSGFSRLRTAKGWETTSILRSIQQRRWWRFQILSWKRTEVGSLCVESLKNKAKWLYYTENTHLC